MSLIGLLTIVLTFVPLVMAVIYAVRPTERRLALMRPLSLGGLFAALTGSTLGFINVFVYLGRKEEWSAHDYVVTAVASAESLVPLFLGFACLTAAWLLVAAGMGRQGE